MKTTVNVILLLCSLMICSKVHAASITYSNSIDVDGSLKLVTPGSFLQFPDGTQMTSAVYTDGTAIWGQITGLIQNQTDLQNALQLKEDKSNKNTANGYCGLDQDGKIPVQFLPQSDVPMNLVVASVFVNSTSPSWLTDVSEWTEITAFTTSIIKSSTSSIIDIYWTDNVGIFHTNWCNIGIFIDQSTNPSCYGSWSGVYNNTTFSQQSLHCKITALSAGIHTFAVKHRSQYCVYGNYHTDEYSTMRQLRIEEL